jgi:hypothetical protein
MPKLRPINDTRGPHGQFTSETALRLLRRRGGLARAKQLRARGFRDLEYGRIKSIIVRRLKAHYNKPVCSCGIFREQVLSLLSRIHREGSTNLTAEELKLL